MGSRCCLLRYMRQQPCFIVPQLSLYTHPTLCPLTPSQVRTIEFTQIQAAVVHGLEQGSAVLAQLQKEMSLDRVERLMDSSREGIEYQREIDEALMSNMSPEEEEEVQAELARLEAEAMVSPGCRGRQRWLLYHSASACSHFCPCDKLLTSQPAIPNVPDTQPVHLPDAPVQEPTEAQPEAENAQGTLCYIRPLTRQRPSQNVLLSPPSCTSMSCIFLSYR